MGSCLRFMMRRCAAPDLDHSGWAQKRQFLESNGAWRDPERRFVRVNDAAEQVTCVRRTEDKRWASTPGRHSVLLQFGGELRDQ